MAEANNTDANGIDRLFQRMRSDLMYELRNIKHGERPVTGQGNRENLEQFMTKNFPQLNDDNTKGNVSNDVTEDLRPESVVVEVQGVIERRPVSSILQSAAFRRQLENVVRGSIQRSPRPAATIGRGTRFNNSNTNGRSSPDNRQNRGSNESINQSAPPVPRPRTTISSGVSDVPGETQRSSEILLPPLVRSDSTSSIDSFSSARSSAYSDNDIDDIDEPTTSPLTNSHASSEQNITQGRNSQNDEIGQPPRLGNVSWNTISQVQQEGMVEEISDLLHSRLVSSTLESEFRATLELLVQERVSASGTNGPAVQNFIRSLPPSGVVQNDFTDIGIPPVQDLDNLETVSVTSFSAHQVPYTQTNSHLSREIQSLKSQMMEMKNMLKLTFDLQMDIQRAVRQEVAAAMSLAAAQGASASVLSSPVTSKPVSDTHCLICLDHHSDCVLYQCGHMCVCYACGRDLVSRNHGCPVCRAPIKDVIRAYKTNVD